LSQQFIIKIFDVIRIHSEWHSSASFVIIRDYLESDRCTRCLSWKLFIENTVGITDYNAFTYTSNKCIRRRCTM